MTRTPDATTRRPLRLRLSLRLLRLACAVAPSERRAELRQQWEAELWHRWRRMEGTPPPGHAGGRSALPKTSTSPPGRGLVLWSLGAFRHTWYLLRAEYTMDLIWQDVKYGFRSLRRGRALIATAVLSLAIGIGANTSIFSAVDVFMLRPLPYPHSERLNLLWTANQDRGWQRASFSAPDYQDIRDQTTTMELAAFRWGTFSLSGENEAERLRGMYVAPDFFKVLGVQPPVGRAFTQDEGRVGNDRVAIISDGLWRRRFGGDPSTVGSSIVLDGEAYTVVGVMPPHFWFIAPGGDVWTPLAFSGQERRDGHNLSVLARVRDGSTDRQALAEANRVMGRLAEQYPETSAGNSASIQLLRDRVFDDGFKSGTLIATVAVAFVLLIACANVANLLLAHSAGREREVALRGALGAARSRIVRQFLTESTLVALAGGLLGLGLAVFGIRALVSVMPAQFPRVYEIGLSPRVLGYTAALTMLTGILFGLAPAFSSSGANLTDSLKDGTRGGSGARGGRLRSSLVVTEVALALVLLVSSALLVQGFARIRLADLGFDRTDVLTAQTMLPEAQYPDLESVNDFDTRLRARLAAIPGVETVGATDALPLQGMSGAWYVIGGQDYNDQAVRKVLGFKYVLPGYFQSLDVPLLRGRDIQDTDRAGSPPVVVINETLARAHWPDGDPVGQQIITASGPKEIVGVVGDTRDAGADAPSPAMAYFPASQTAQRFMDWAIEASVPLATLVEPVRAAVRAVDPTVPAYEVMTLDDLIDQSLGGDLIMARIMAALAIIALVLALGGVYGVMAYTVSQRTREMGIRLSLGAQRRAVMAMVVRQGAKLALLGVVIGVAVALGVTRGLARFLFGVSPFDLGTFASVAGLLLLAGLAATLLPARKATKVDPVVSLRTE